jgi:2-polyprenyl-3-methyl-5-hydroxy-6-metoxy-1,4-benzoquinol methylase
VSHFINPEILGLDRGGSWSSQSEDAALSTSSGDVGGHQTDVVPVRLAKLSKAARAVATVFCAQSNGWSSKRNLIEQCDGVSDRATALLLDSLQPGVRILDLGAGAGKVAEKVLAAEPTARLTLVDHAPGMVRNLRERFSGNQRVRILQADLHVLPKLLSGERFDMITLFQVLHHVPRPGMALKTAASLMAAGGCVIVLTVGPRYQEAVFPRTRRDGLGRRQISNWVALAEAAGLDVEVVHNDQFLRRFRDGLAFAQFQHSNGSLEKLAGYYLLTGEELDRALHDVAMCATGACADEVGKIIVPCEHVTVVARRGRGPVERR